MTLTLHIARGASVELGWGVRQEPESPHPRSEAPESLSCPPGLVPAAPENTVGSTHPRCEDSAHGPPPAGGMSTSKSPGADLARKDTCRQPRRPPEIPRFTGQALVSGKKNASQLLKRPSGLLPSPAKARQMLLERAGPARVTRPPSYVCLSVSADTGHRAEKTIHFGPRQRASGRPGLGSLARLFIYSLSLARQLCKEVLE